MNYLDYLGIAALIGMVYGVWCWLKYSDQPPPLDPDDSDFIDSARGQNETQD